MLAAVDFHGLFEVVWVSFVAGVGVTVLFSLAIYGFGRADEQRRAGEATVGYVALAVIALVVFGAAVIYGVAVMLEKK